MVTGLTDLVMKARGSHSRLNPLAVQDGLTTTFLPQLLVRDNPVYHLVDEARAE
jgi:hypothetical protein